MVLGGEIKIENYRKSELFWGSIDFWRKNKFTHINDSRQARYVHIIQRYAVQSIYTQSIGHSAEQREHSPQATMIHANTAYSVRVHPRCSTLWPMFCAYALYSIARNNVNMPCLTRNVYMGSSFAHIGKKIATCPKQLKRYKKQHPETFHYFQPSVYDNECAKYSK